MCTLLLLFFTSQLTVPGVKMSFRQLKILAYAREAQESKPV